LRHELPRLALALAVAGALAACTVQVQGTGIVTSGSPAGASKPSPAGSVKPEPGRPEPAKPDPSQPDPAKPDPGQPSPAKPNPGQPDPAKPDPGKPLPVGAGKYGLPLEVRTYRECDNSDVVAMAIDAEGRVTRNEAARPEAPQPADAPVQATPEGRQPAIASFQATPAELAGLRALLGELDLVRLAKENREEAPGGPQTTDCKTWRTYGFTVDGARAVVSAGARGAIETDAFRDAVRKLEARLATLGTGATPPVAAEPGQPTAANLSGNWIFRAGVPEPAAGPLARACYRQNWTNVRREGATYVMETVCPVCDMMPNPLKGPIQPGRLALQSERGSRIEMTYDAATGHLLGTLDGEPGWGAPLSEKVAPPPGGCGD